MGRCSINWHGYVDLEYKIMFLKDFGMKASFHGAVLVAANPACPQQM